MILKFETLNKDQDALCPSKIPSENNYTQS